MNYQKSNASSYVLESINHMWLDLIQQMTASQEKEEEKYEEMVSYKQGILNLINRGKEAIINVKFILRWIRTNALTPIDTKEIPASTYHSMVNFPQLPVQSLLATQNCDENFGAASNW